MKEFGQVFPDRMFDVGIAEQHAVTFAGGLAADGYKPFCAIYSTFLQRGYDQVVHDVALQNLPVRFAMDRAGLVGADGPTHAGAFDIAYLGCLPNMVLMAAADENELARMVPLEIGKGRVLREGSSVAIFSYGTRLAEAMAAADSLEALGLSSAR